MYYRGCLPFFFLLLLTTPFAAPGSPLQPPRRLRLPPLWLPQNKHNYPHFSADADASQGNSAKVRERLLHEKQFKDPLSEVNVGVGAKSNGTKVNHFKGVQQRQSGELAGVGDPLRRRNMYRVNLLRNSHDNRISYCYYL